MRKFSLLLATPLLLLSACTLKINDGDTDTATDTTDSSGATDSNSSDPTDGTTTDNPDNDNCVPMNPGTTGTAGTSGTATGGEDPGGTAGGTAGDETGTGGDGTGTAGGTAGGCEPLPEENPSALDFNCECDVPGENRACQTPDKAAGVRFCDSGNWGPCIAEPECLPGTYTTCSDCDPILGTVVSWCVMVDGVPQNNADVDCAP